MPDPLSAADIAELQRMYADANAKPIWGDADGPPPAAVLMARVWPHLPALLDAAKAVARRERIENHTRIGARFRNPQGVELRLIDPIYHLEHATVLGPVWVAERADAVFGPSRMVVTVDGLISCGYEPTKEVVSGE